jgi:hypothetical protein
MKAFEAERGVQRGRNAQKVLRLMDNLGYSAIIKEDTDVTMRAFKKYAEDLADRYPRIGLELELDSVPHNIQGQFVAWFQDRLLQMHMMREDNITMAGNLGTGIEQVYTADEDLVQDPVIVPYNDPTPRMHGVKVTVKGTPLAPRYDIQTVTRTGLEWGLVGPVRGSQCSLFGGDKRALAFCRSFLERQQDRQPHCETAAYQGGVGRRERG